MASTASRSIISGCAVLGEARTVEMLAGGAPVLGSLVVLMSLVPPAAKRKPEKEESHAVQPLNARCPVAR
jgi:hypothetical protein